MSSGRIQSWGTVHLWLVWKPSDQPVRYLNIFSCTDLLVMTLQVFLLFLMLEKGENWRSMIFGIEQKSLQSVLDCASNAYLILPRRISTYSLFKTLIQMASKKLPISWRWKKKKEEAIHRSIGVFILFCRRRQQKVGEEGDDVFQGKGKQCDQMAKLFFHFWPLAKVKFLARKLKRIAKVGWKFCQTLNKP